MIQDVVIRSLDIQMDTWGEAIKLLGESDTLLHRIAEVDWIRFEPPGPTILQMDRKADIVWILLSGALTVCWLDLRSISPTQGERMERQVSAPALLLVPFGVAFGFGEESDTLLLRLSTEALDHGGAGNRYTWDGSPLE